ncbi:MAG: M13 family metallopeptidase [Candidatus Cyclobacteriaceae bacterium M3_2C_046]
MKHNLIYFITGLLVVAFSACQSGNQEKEMVSGLDLSNMDTTVAPADDFYRFVNGGWMEKVEMPADRGRWGSFDELRKATSEKVLAVLEEAIQSGKYDASTDQAKAALFYQTAMDTTYLDQVGMEPLYNELSEIDNIEDLKDLEHYLIKSASWQNSYLFGFGVDADLNNSSYNAAFLGSGALGLPERDYYTKDDEDTKNIQEEYKKHIARMFGFMEVEQEEAAELAQEIFQLEARMAQAMLTKEDRRNPLLMNNPRSVAELNEIVPAIDWRGYFTGIGAAQVDTVIVTDINYVKSLASLLKEENLPVIKDYLKWTLLNASASYLTTDLDQANFEFYGKVLRGTPAQRERWERVLDQANWSIGEAIGKLYTDKYFPPEAKASAEEMVSNILAAFGDRIKDLDWMTDDTKEKALHKLSTFKVKIGYPDQWKDYGDLEIEGKDEGGSYLGNIINITEWNWDRDLAKIGKPVDKTEWLMAPQVVNAYYNPLYNEIVFPAAILQPPFYNYQADPAVNYGGIGAVIGHEVSHGFDDQGSRFDADGNLKNWWTDQDRTNFEERTKLLISQYDNYEVLEGVNVNGTFTLGENIGDLGGVNVAYDGLKRHLKEHGDPGLIDGYNQDQRFFLSWGTIWRTKYRDETLKNQINTDPHSPGMIRAIGPLENVAAFYEAFNVNENSDMFKPASERIYIW